MLKGRRRHCVLFWLECTTLRHIMNYKWLCTKYAIPIWCGRCGTSQYIVLCHATSAKSGWRCVWLDLASFDGNIIRPIRVRYIFRPFECSTLRYSIRTAIKWCRRQRVESISSECENIIHKFADKFRFQINFATTRISLAPAVHSIYKFVNRLLSHQPSEFAISHREKNK